MKRTSEKYQSYVRILQEELIPAMGCTEPIALAFAAAKAREVLGKLPKRIDICVSNNIIKNVKSVIVPNTGGLKGIQAAVTAGIISGKSEKCLEVISEVSEEEKQQIRKYLQNTEFQITVSDSPEIFDIVITAWAEGSCAVVRIARYHTNIVLIKKDEEILFEKELSEVGKTDKPDTDTLNLEDILDFARTFELSDLEEILSRQSQYNMAIAEEGMCHKYGANIGKTMQEVYGNDVRNRAIALAAAGSDARMSGCELPVVINSGSGNQGMTVSIPVIVYARELKVSEEEMYRALALSNLIAIHTKSGIGRLSAYCGAVTAGCAAGCGIAYLYGGGYTEIAHTLVNSLAIVSGIICDGAKASCAAKIASSVEAGILGYHMFMNGQEFKYGDGIVNCGVEETIQNIYRLGKEGMKETDKEIVKIMLSE